MRRLKKELFKKSSISLFMTVFNLDLFPFEKQQKKDIIETPFSNEQKNLFLIKLIKRFIA